jgi:uncharacterized damage-inducible protein DinB
MVNSVGWKEKTLLKYFSMTGNTNFDEMEENFPHRMTQRYNLLKKESAMNVTEYIQRETAGVRRAINGTMQTMTSELFNWAPPGTANTISATLLHLLNSEDHFIQGVIQNKPSIWESGDWSKKTGVSKLPTIGEDWSRFKHTHTEFQPILEYEDAVWAATDAYLSTLTEQELDRKLQFAGREMSVADMLLLSASHSLGHNGEIAALKGVQGAKGLLV